MENIVNTFYKGNINKFGFGGWNTTKNNIKEVLESYPYPSNANRKIMFHMNITLFSMKKLIFQNQMHKKFVHYLCSNIKILIIMVL